MHVFDDRLDIRVTTDFLDGFHAHLAVSLNAFLDCLFDLRVSEFRLIGSKVLDMELLAHWGATLAIQSMAFGALGVKDHLAILRSGINASAEESKCYDAI